MKEEKKDNALIVIVSIVRDLSAMRRNYSTYIVKGKNQENMKHLKKR